MWSLFNRKPKEVVTTVTPPPASRVEIEVHKNASREVKQAADEVNNHVQGLLSENGFTIKIAVAAGRKNITGKGH